jgi:putative heme-binding domain-containing protein
MLAESLDEKVRAVMTRHLAKDASPPPGELYQRYAQSLQGDGDLVQGEAVFKRVCGTCHAPEAGRERVGPDLLTVVDQPKEQILLSILDPNREVNPKYARVQIVTLSGQVLSGVVSAENDATVTLLDSQGKSYAIARGDIEELQTSTHSLMPEELYKEISPEQMRDLIDYVIQRRGAVAASAGANEK